LSHVMFYDFTDIYMYMYHVNGNNALARKSEHALHWLKTQAIYNKCM